MAHLLVKNESDYNPERFKLELKLMQAELLNENAPRPFADKEFQEISQRYKDLFKKNGQCLVLIPEYSSSIKPFSD